MKAILSKVTSFFKKLKIFVKQITFYLPTSLPVGMIEFDDWATDILNHTPNVPNNDSAKFALAAAVMHLESIAKFEFNFLVFKLAIPMSAYKSKRYFAQVLLKGAANQVAVGIMNELKAKQKAYEAENANK